MNVFANYIYMFFKKKLYITKSASINRLIFIRPVAIDQQKTIWYIIIKNNIDEKKRLKEKNKYKSRLMHVNYDKITTFGCVNYKIVYPKFKKILTKSIV